MSNVYKIIAKLEATPGRNDKIALLTKNKDDLVLMDVVRRALDPFTLFYIKKIPKYSQSNEGVIDLDHALSQLFDKIASRNLTGNAAIDFVRDELLSRLSQNDAKVLERVILKDLSCGVQESTANKVWPGLIPTYPCMLASGFEQKLVDKIIFPAIAQCLSSDWIVETNNGAFTIQDIVENDLDISVKSYNHTTDMVEFNKVLNKSKTFNSFNEWYRITLNDGTVTKPLTGNHLVWVDNKKDYIRVDKLSIDDTVLSL